ncbi:hypothetical protein GGR55DRAFT_319709 [Xylaria sp. FL0064]|nr:hypothetical protein GGR55DRAFT_319709 [Xylaria sp. FL0064]
MDQHVEDGSAWTATAHNLDFAVQEYLLLQDQHEELCQRLHQLSPSLPLSWTTTTTTAPSISLASTAITSPLGSPSRSPLGASSLTSYSGQRMTPPTWMPSLVSDSRVHEGQLEQDEWLLGEVAAGEQKLFNVNEGMKRALTELLNCEAVRQDRAMRTWVQTRLLETEKELRRGRRRRSSAAVD